VEGHTGCFPTGSLDSYVNIERGAGASTQIYQVPPSPIWFKSVPSTASTSRLASSTQMALWLFTLRLHNSRRPYTTTPTGQCEIHHRMGYFDGSRCRYWLHSRRASRSIGRCRFKPHRFPHRRCDNQKSRKMATLSCQ